MTHVQAFYSEALASAVRYLLVAIVMLRALTQFLQL